MRKLKCIFTADSGAFKAGSEYSSDDRHSYVIGEDGDKEDPWQLDGLEVKTKMGVVARFEKVA
ncbi:hypothetical protein QM327_16710 [Pantoea dispersa]|uniref:hypothetical protein n=1 Tax=Pantoea dispersa TaxID=59814 RepID=UPI0024B82279|nr:hypothetical protein [Pantoea dispersa]MDI9768195.1 hypothetical protein [Pantoea dispersa]